MSLVIALSCGDSYYEKTKEVNENTSKEYKLQYAGPES